MSLLSSFLPSQVSGLLPGGILASNPAKFGAEILRSDNQRDWQHAAKTFIANNFKYAPKFGFLFHVSFSINPGAIANNNRMPRDAQQMVGALVKAVTLPTFTFDTKMLNAYNRPNLVQTKIKYEPLTITFHDDCNNTINGLWWDYYKHYYRDADHATPMYRHTHKYEERPTTAWGYSPIAANQSTVLAPTIAASVDVPYFNTIDIYQLNQKKFMHFTLINPMITRWRHGEQSRSSDEMLESEMEIAFESIKYATGIEINEETVPGISAANYDKGPSPLGPHGGGTQSAFGYGGTADTFNTVMDDLSKGNFTAAALAGAHGLDNLSRMNVLDAAKTEILSGATSIFTGGNPANKFFFPGVPKGK